MLKPSKSVGMLLALLGISSSGVVHADAISDVAAVNAAQQNSTCTGIVIRMHLVKLSLVRL